MKNRFTFLEEIMHEAEQMVLSYYQKNILIETKNDGSFVTEADRQVEKFIRQKIAKTYPQDGVIGEEFPSEDQKGHFTWTIDPIDGTSSFIRGVPFFGCMIGLMEQDLPIAGMISFPALQETFFAKKNEGAFWRSQHLPRDIRCHVSTTSKIDQSLFLYSTPQYFGQHHQSLMLEKLRKECQSERTWGDCYGHMLVASGRADIMVDPFFNLWDLIPVKIIVEEAGGECPGTLYENPKRYLGISANKKLFNYVHQMLTP
jgi:histidinol-phosphatase